MQDAALLSDERARCTTSGHGYECEGDDATIAKFFSHCSQFAKSNGESVVVCLTYAIGKPIYWRAIPNGPGALSGATLPFPKGTLASAKVQRLRDGKQPWTCLGHPCCLLTKLCCCLPCVVCCKTGFPVEGAVKVEYIDAKVRCKPSLGIPVRFLHEPRVQGQTVSYAGCSGCSNSKDDVELLELSLYAAGLRRQPEGCWRL